MKKLYLFILSAAVIAFAAGCGKRAEQAGSSAESSSPATAAEPSAEQKWEAPKLEEIAAANKISSLLDSYSSIYADTEFYTEDGAISHLSQYWKMDDFGPVGLFYQTDPTEKDPFYEYMYDGRAYRKEYDGSLSARFASSGEAIRAFREEIDLTCSPLTIIGDETVISSSLNGDFIDLETRIGAASLTSGQKEKYEITQGYLFTNIRLDAKDLRVISLDIFRQDPDGTQTLLSKMTLETNTDQPDLPSFMKEFENLEETRTITLIFNPGTPEENSASYALPRDAGFYPAYEEEFYDIYGDVEKTITFSELVKSATRGADLTLYLFKK